MQTWQSAGHDIVLMMDINEPAGHGSAVDRFIYACGLTDVHTRSTETIDPPPTYQRGSSKIDFILVSPRVAQAVIPRAILPIHDGYLLDHRALLVDLNARILFAGPTSEIVSPSTQQLTSTNPKAVTKYLRHMLHLVEKHGIWQKVTDLHKLSTNGEWSSDATQQWESVDRLLAQARIFAEHKCGKKKSGHLPWSPELRLSGETLLYWKLRYRKYTSRNLKQKMLDRLAADCKIPAEEIAWLSCANIRTKVREARKEHKQVKINATELRELHMTDQAHFLAALHGMSDVSARAAIAAREISSRQFRTLRAIFHKGRSNGLERLDVPNDFAVLRRDKPQPRVRLITKEGIEGALLPHTVRRFRQHKETPFGYGARSVGLGQDCSSADFADLINGTYDRELEQLSAEAREWLRQLKHKDFSANGSHISTNISTDNWISGWMKMRESTASAPGGHYGHYKTAATVARLPVEHPDHTRVLADIYATMLSLPLLHGFAPARWKYCVDAILEKSPGKPVIEKLRIIMLYKVRFQFYA